MGSNGSLETRNESREGLMLCWRSGLGSIFGLENVHSRAASCTLWVSLVWASFTLVQAINKS